MAGPAKENRDEWEVNLMAAVSDLDMDVVTVPNNKRNLEVKIRSVESAFEGLKKAHATYCRKAKLSLSSSDSAEFIKEQTRVKAKSIAAARNLITEGDESSESSKHSAKLSSEQFQLKIKVEGLIASLETMAGITLLTREQYSNIMDMIEEGQTDLIKYMEHSELILSESKSEEVEKKGKEVQEFYKTSYTNLSNLKCKFLSKAPIKTDEMTPTATRVVATAPAQSETSKQPVKIKAMNCPTWDGKYRTFPRFKKMWDENITPRHEDTALHYLLCQALPKSVLENISTLSDSAQDIWAYLDEKFGKSDVVAREVMGELLSQDHKKLGKKFISKFTTMLIDTEALLESINEIDWLTSNKSVAELEDKLPQSERVEWAKQMRSVTGGSKYERFKNHLVMRKKILEDIDSMGCKVLGEDNCSYCSKPGHVENDCFSKRRDQKLGSSKLKGGCAICKEDGHWKNECPLKGTGRDNKTNKSGIKVQGKQGNDSSGSGVISAGVGSNTLRALECQRCKAAHKLSFCAGCKKTSGISHCLLHCEGYMILSVKERVDMVKTAKHCAICLHPNHTADSCYNKEKDTYICGVNGCTSHHHPSLHGSRDVYVTGVNALLMQRVDDREGYLCDGYVGNHGCIGVGQDYAPVNDFSSRIQFIHDSYSSEQFHKGAVNIVKTKREIELDEVIAELTKPLIDGEKVLMNISYIPTVSGIEGKISKIVGFFDNGSTCSIIKNAVAEGLKLYGDPITLELGTVNATSRLETKLYVVELLDTVGGRHLIKAFGLETLSGPLPTVHLDGIKHEFSQEVQDNWEKFARPTGEMELLIGSEVAHLHPQHYETVGSVVVNKSIFGTGWLLNGAHEKLVCAQVETSCHLQIMRTGSFRNNRIVASYNQSADIDYSSGMGLEMTEKQFFQAESLGCEPPRRCQDCRGCLECGFRAETMSQREYLELQQMEDNIYFDESINKWRVKYAFKQDPRILKNNYKRVLRIAESTERKLRKFGKTEEANELFIKLLEIGAIEEVTSAELTLWKGPVHYLPVQAVIKESSVTTPLRLVTNSSLVDPETGLSLNSILISGPNCLNDMWEMLVRFRHHECGLIGDITKAYYQMKTGQLEKHLRRVLWRFGMVGEPWKMYAFVVVSMGDNPAANFMELTKKKTDDRGQHIDQVATRKAKNESFVDDLSTGGSKEECLRFKGREDPHTLECDGTIPQILEAGGFKLKAMAMSGEEDGESLEKLGKAVLGLGFSTEEDTLSIKFRINIPGHLKVDEEFTADSLGLLTDVVLTKKTCLSIVSSQ